VLAPRCAVLKCSNKISVLEANKNEMQPGGKLILALHMKVRSEQKKNAFRAAG
jgi:tRNA(Phe) wybutosine-synthesizing methylase Tyw3